MRFTIQLCDMTASATGFAGILRINCNHWYPSKNSFVLNKSPQFSKSPFPKLFTLLFSNRYSKAIQILNSNGSLSVFSNLNDLFGNDVVDIALESSFFARELFKMSLSGLGAFPLKALFETAGFDANLVSCLARESLAIGGGCKIDNAEINSKHAFRFDGSPVWQFYDKAEIEVALLINKIRLASNSALLKLGIGAEDNGNFEPTVNAKDGYCVKAPKRKYPLIIDKGRMLLKDMLSLFLNTVGLLDLTYGPHCHLGRETKVIPHIPVAQVMKGYLTKFFVLPSYLRDIIAGIIENLNSFYQRGFLLGCWKQFDFDCEFHVYKI